MKRVVFIVLGICLVLCGGCSASAVSGTMHDAEPLPATIFIEDKLGVSDFNVVLKDVVIRKMTNIEMEKSSRASQDGLNHMAILRYSSKKANEKMSSNYISLNNKGFALVIGDNTYKDIVGISAIPLEENEYMTEEFKDDYYQGYLIILIDEKTAKDSRLQLRYIPVGTTKAEYFNIK